MYRKLIFLCLILFIHFSSTSQETRLSTEELEAYKQNAQQLVAYFEGTLNFLGDNKEVVAEKDIIVNESYLKVFQDAETQIEDDLDENRKTPLNKDVQAYLKDIMFFYKKVTFAFRINAIDQQINQNGQIFFKITTNRTLQGISVNGDTVNNNLVRYFEINLDQQKKDLKIASIYTTKLNEKDEMRNWWNNLSTSWKQVFGRSVLVYDTLPFMNILSFSDSTIVTFKWIEDQTDNSVLSIMDTLEPIESNDSSRYALITTSMIQIPDTIKTDVSTIYRILRAFRSQKKITISHNHVIRNLEPLSELTELTELDMSYTLIGDLKPIRNLNKLEILNLEGSSISSIDAIRYLTSLKELNCGLTQVSSLEVLENLNSLLDLNLQSVGFSESTPLNNLANLKHLNLQSTHPLDFNGISNLSSLTDLNLASSSISNLENLKNLNNLQYLNIDSTSVINLSPLSGLTGLSVIQANHSPISNLEPLTSIPGLKAIYCDNSGITMEKAAKFMELKPECLVVYNSQNLINWWSSLDSEWKQIFKKSFALTEPMTKEQLHQLINQENLSLAYNKNIQRIEPLSMLHRLEKLDLSHTSIENLNSLDGLNNLKLLNLSNTPVSSLEALTSLQNLKEIDITKTTISDLLPLQNSLNLSKIYCDNSQVKQEQVIAFRKIVPECVVIYQTENLSLWWNLMSPAWKSAFNLQQKVANTPSAIELQQLADLTRFEVSNNPDLAEITPLNMLLWLEKLSMSNTGVSNLNPISNLKMLTELQVPQNPVTDIGMLAQIATLEMLNLENTPVDDLSGIKGLVGLKILNISGTQVKSLKYLSSVTNLEELSINNTKIKNIKPLDDLKNIQLFKCYNTRLKKSKVDEFLQQHPTTEVVFY